MIVVHSETRLTAKPQSLLDELQAPGIVSVVIDAAISLAYRATHAVNSLSSRCEEAKSEMLWWREPACRVLLTPVRGGFVQYVIILIIIITTTTIPIPIVTNWESASEKTVVLSMSYACGFAQHQGGK